MLNSKRKFIVFGHKRHGKDTASEIIEKNFGLKFQSSSFFACQKFLFERLKEKFNYSSMEECYNDRFNHRELWYESIRDYNTSDKARLGRELFEQFDIYCGIRDLEEFKELKKGRMFDLAIFIDASDRRPPECSSSMKLSKSDADIIIDNNGDLEVLEERLNRLFLALGYSLIK